MFETVRIFGLCWGPTRCTNAGLLHSSERNRAHPAGKKYLVLVVAAVTGHANVAACGVMGPCIRYPPAASSLSYSVILASPVTPLVPLWQSICAVLTSCSHASAVDHLCLGRSPWVSSTRFRVLLLCFYFLLRFLRYSHRRCLDWFLLFLQKSKLNLCLLLEAIVIYYTV